MDWKKRGLTFLLDLVFTAGILGFFYWMREWMAGVIAQINTLGPALAQLEQEAATESFTANSVAALEGINSLATNTLLVNQVIMPIFLIVLFIVTQMLVWKYLNKTPFVRFASYSILPFVLFLLFGSMFLELLMWAFMYLDFSWFWFIVVILLLLFTSYYALVWNVHWKDGIKKLFKRRQVIGPYLLLVLATLFYLIVMSIFFIGLISSSIGFMAFVWGIVSLVAFNYARSYYIRKARN